MGAGTAESVIRSLNKKLRFMDLEIRGCGRKARAAPSWPTAKARNLGTISPTARASRSPRRWSCVGARRRRRRRAPKAVSRAPSSVGADQPRRGRRLEDGGVAALAGRGASPLLGHRDGEGVCSKMTRAPPTASRTRYDPLGRPLQEDPRGHLEGRRVHGLDRRPQTTERAPASHQRGRDDESPAMNRKSSRRSQDDGRASSSAHHRRMRASRRPRHSLGRGAAFCTPPPVGALRRVYRGPRREALARPGGRRGLVRPAVLPRARGPAPGPRGHGPANGRLLDEPTPRDCEFEACM